MIRQTAIPPSKVIRQNKQILPSLGLPNDLTDAAGIHFNPIPIEVNGRVLPPPALQFGGQNRSALETIREDATWKGVGQYLKPAKCEKWMALAISTEHNRMDQRDFRLFLNSILILQPFL